MTALHGVTKRFGGRAVLDDLTFEFAERTRYVISGPSGCGKSTLLNVLAGYVTPDSGRLTTPRSVGYLFQDELLFSNLTVRQNLMIRQAALFGSEPPEPYLVEHALKRANVEALIDHPVSHLSGGERQRVQFAVLLMASPELVLLDEPTSRLDPHNSEDIAAAATELFGDSTVIVVSHDEHTPLLRGAEKLVLRDGALHG